MSKIQTKLHLSNTKTKELEEMLRYTHGMFSWFPSCDVSLRGRALLVFLSVPCLGKRDVVQPGGRAQRAERDRCCSGFFQKIWIKGQRAIGVQNYRAYVDQVREDRGIDPADLLEKVGIDSGTNCVRTRSEHTTHVQRGG